MNRYWRLDTSSGYSTLPCMYKDHRRDATTCVDMKHKAEILNLGALSHTQYTTPLWKVHQHDIYLDLARQILDCD